MKKELKIGVIIVLALGFVIWGVNFLKGKNFFSSTKNYYVIYDEVNGLLEANGVFIKGYKIGHVGSIGFSDKSMKKLRVILAIQSNVKIPKGSTARIYSVDLLGTKAVEILFSDNNNNLRGGDTLKSDIEISVAKQLEPYKVQAYHLLNSMDSLSNAILKIFDSEAIHNLRTTFKNARMTTEIIESSIDPIKTSFENIESMTQNLKENNKKVSVIIKNLETFSDTLSNLKLKSSVAELNQTLMETRKILVNINQGKGTLGKLITNDTLYLNLHKSLSDLDTLINDLKKNPKRYVHFSVF